MEIPWKSHGNPMFFFWDFPMAMNGWFNHWDLRMFANFSDQETLNRCSCRSLSSLNIWFWMVLMYMRIPKKNNNCVFLCDVTNKKLVMRISSFKIWRFSAIFMVHEIHTSSFLAFCDTLIVTNCGNVGHQPRAWQQPSASHRWIHAKIWGMCWVTNSKPQVMVKLWAPNADWVWFSIPQISS